MKTGITTTLAVNETPNPILQLEQRLMLETAFQKRPHDDAKHWATDLSWGPHVARGGIVDSTTQGVHLLECRGQIKKPRLTPSAQLANDGMNKFGKFLLDGLLSKEDVEAISEISGADDVFDDASHEISERLGTICDDLHKTQQADWDLAWDYYASDETAAQVNGRLRKGPMEPDRVLFDYGRIKVSAGGFCGSLNRLARELPVGLELTRVLSDGTKHTISGEDTKTTCGVTPDSNEIRSMRADLEEGRLCMGTILRERGVMSTSPDTCAHGELADCAGIELRLFVGPGVKGIAISEDGRVVDVMFPPGQKIALTGIDQATKREKRLKVSAVLLPSDFSGALSEGARAKLALCTAISSGDLDTVERTIQSHPKVIQDPNILAGCSAESLALHRWAHAVLINAEGCDKYFKIARMIREVALASVKPDPPTDWFGKQLSEHIGALVDLGQWNKSYSNGRLLAGLLELSSLAEVRIP